ncbi:DUF4192 domain-containing protein [Kibdelosporangium persicum]|uniref:DUF4192 domain-containing protein n=1 Tax=Kibdelosporangium persicum TaxID=2698649 RepID=A0ABX2FGV4_9PSEU|nr:DUF4192 domain-containing protein [Kibdelosporangium persicum]NRN69975.1 hypothetical protein [Kibdelosporangium persicum]
MQTQQRPRVQLRDTGELIAAVPHLLGFRPTESVVVCVYTYTGLRTQITACLRADIPPPDLYVSLAEQLKVPALRANSCVVSLIIVSEHAGRPPDPLPCTELVDALTQVFAASGVFVNHAFWAPRIEANTTWWCYADLECHGSIPDPGSSELAAAAATLGTVTYDSKEELRATLEPADRAPLAARAERISAAVRLCQDETYAQQLLDTLIDEVRAGSWTLDEARLVDLAVALTNVRVRDGCLRPEVTSIGHPVERLWSALTRELPAPYRAEPACLLALTAFLRGDGVLAGVATEIAMEADPDHRIAMLLRHSMDFGLPPESVARAVAQSFLGPPDNSCR